MRKVLSHLHVIQYISVVRKGCVNAVCSDPCHICHTAGLKDCGDCRGDHLSLRGSCHIDCLRLIFLRKFYEDLCLLLSLKSFLTCHEDLGSSCCDHGLCISVLSKYNSDHFLAVCLCKLCGLADCLKCCTDRCTVCALGVDHDILSICIFHRLNFLPCLIPADFTFCAGQSRFCRSSIHQIAFASLIMASAWLTASAGSSALIFTPAALFAGA